MSWLIPAGISLVGAFAGSRGGDDDRSSKPKKLSTLDSSQQSLMKDYQNSLYGKGPFSDAFGMDPEAIQNVFQQNFAQPAYQNFQEEVVPGITGAFRGKNLQNSSYLGGALGKAGTRVQQDLNAKLAQMMYDAQQQGFDRRIDAVRNIIGTQKFAYERPQEKDTSDPFMDIISGLAPKAFEYALNKWG